MIGLQLYTRNSSLSLNVSLTVGKEILLKKIGFMDLNKLSLEDCSL